jgi:septum formation protein
MRIVLASTSPRRRDLLALLGIAFEIRDPSYEERIVSGRSAVELVAHFSRGKADSIAQQDEDALVLASDTLIEVDEAVLGKPRDQAEARSMLRRLAGREHRVQTAVTVACRTRQLESTDGATARVWMKPYEADAHDCYLASGDSLGKAGGYAIQGSGADLIERLDGDFTTVVGLPLRLAARLLKQAGVKVRVDVDELYRRKPYGNWTRFPG